MQQQSRTVPAGHQGHGDDPAPRHLPLVDLLIDTRAELTELVVRSGLKVLATMLEEDRTAVCGPRYVHQADRQAVRAGSVPSDVVLGGRKVALRRPRVRAADVAAKYRVSGSWVRLLKQRRRETGEVAPRVQRHGRRCMLEPHLHTLAVLIAAQPDRTLAELKDALATPASVPTVWRAVRALGLTVKKNGPPVRTRSAWRFRTQYLGGRSTSFSST